MNKCFWLITLSLWFRVSHCQELVRTYEGFEQFLLKQTFNSSLEVVEIDELDLVTAEEIKKPLVEKLRGFQYFDHLVNNYEVFKSEFKVIDLNLDGKLDIFYSGYLGGAADSYSYVFINNGTTFNKVFTGSMGLFLSALAENQKPAGLLYCYEGAAVGCLEICSIELLTFSISDYHSEVIVRYPSAAELPENHLKAPIPFKVENEIYHLRGEAKINNHVWDECEFVGNICASYTKNDTGKAYAQKTDPTGRVWWFVIMNDNMSGWMSSRYLTKL